MIKPALRAGRVTLFLCAWLALPLAAVAADPSLREADKHFQHGVQLYVEADYKGALVEFNRAYALSPNGTVLFNIAETQYQLRDYAAALASFDHFLAETAQNDPHRPLAESNVRELRTRVGRLRIVTVPPGAEVSIDDRVIGKTPFEEPVIVGIGRVVVRATVPGRQPAVRSVDVAAEDDVAVTLEMVGSVSAAALRAEAPASAAPTTSSAAVTITERPEAAPPKDTAGWRTAGWVATGLLAGGAVTFGLLAYDASSKLKDARGDYPAKATTIKYYSDRTVRFSTIADSLTAGAVVFGGITLYSTLTAHSENGTAATLALGPASVGLNLRF